VIAESPAFIALRFFCSSIFPRLLTSTLFPYTTLFRSRLGLHAESDHDAGRARRMVRRRRQARLSRDGDYGGRPEERLVQRVVERDRKSTRLNSSHDQISYAVFCLKKKKLNT